MAFARIAFTTPQYEDFPNYWLKAFEQGTTTPKVMAIDPSGTPVVAKIQLNSLGFPVTAGDAMVIPLIDGAYDLWAFPTEAEANANDTSNALLFADNVTGVTPDGEGGSTTIVKEKQTLSAGQTTVTSSTLDLGNAIIHVNEDSIDSRQLTEPEDYTITDSTEIELVQSFPNGTILSAVGPLIASITSTIGGDFPSDAALPKHAMTLDFTFSDAPNSGMQGFDYDEDNNLIYISQNIVPGGSSTHDPDEMVQFAVYDFKEDGTNVVPNSFTPQLNLGHGQDMSLTKEGDKIYLWTSAATPVGISGDIQDYDGVTQTRTNVDGGRFIARVEYKGAATTNSDITTFRLMDDFDTLDDDTWFNKVTPKISTCGKFIVARFSNMRGSELPKIRVWNKSDVEAGTHNNFVADFFVPTQLHADGDIDVVQSVHLHENIIYVQMGNNSPTDKKRLIRFSLNGSLIDHYDFFADTSFLVSPTPTVIEPEGQAFLISGGKTRWAAAFNISSASEVTKAIMVYGLGDPVLSVGDKRSPALIALDDNTYDISVQSGETLNIVSFDYATSVATSILKLTPAFNVNFQNADHIRIKDDRVIRKDDLGVGRESLLIRAKDSLSEGAGISLFGSGDSADPDKVKLIGSSAELSDLDQTTSITWTQGAGTPEGSITANVGSFHSRTNGGAGTSFYVKESGTGNTGWVAK